MGDVGVGAVEPRAEALVEQLDLAPHPEGGFYREIWRSETGVEPVDGALEAQPWDLEGVLARAADQRAEGRVFL